LPRSALTAPRIAPPAPRLPLYYASARCRCIAERGVVGHLWRWTVVMDVVVISSLVAEDIRCQPSAYQACLVRHRGRSRPAEDNHFFTRTHCTLPSFSAAYSPHACHFPHVVFFLFLRLPQYLFCLSLPLRLAATSRCVGRRSGNGGAVKTGGGKGASSADARRRHRTA